MGDSFHNTTGETGGVLQSYEDAAVAQDVAVLTFFRLRPWESFSPSQIHGVVGKGAPVTSIRRAMTNLTKKGCLVKLKDKRTGPFGRPEHLWILRQTQS